VKRVRYYLKLTSWAGYSPVASHYYASLRWADATDDYHYVRLEHNVHDECIFCKGRKCEYCEDKGWVPFKTERFASKDEAISFAMAWFKKNAPKGSLLLEGDAAYVEPTRVVSGPIRVLRAANKVWKKAQTHWERNGPHGKVWDRLCAEWEKIVG
jgi:hypothetical protein